MMKILHLSDTHGLHHQIHDLPEADVIIHLKLMSSFIVVTSATMELRKRFLTS